MAASSRAGITIETVSALADLGPTGGRKPAHPGQEPRSRQQPAHRDCGDERAHRSTATFATVASLRQVGTRARVVKTS